MAKRGRKKMFETEEDLAEHVRKYNREYNRRRYQNDPEFRARKNAQQRKYRNRDPKPPKPPLTEAEKKANQKAYHEKNRDKINARIRWRYHNDPEFRKKRRKERE